MPRSFSNCEMSAPEMNAFSPSPATTITRTDGSASSSASALGTPAHMSNVIAFIFSGLEKRTVATAPSRFTMSPDIR